jgi:hypothetical protein
MKFDKKIIVIDDFYPDHMNMRDVALNAEYEPRDNTRNYPGSNSLKSYWNEEINNLFCEATGERIAPDLMGACGYFRNTNLNDRSKQIIHFDPNHGIVWAGVVYLSLPEHYIQDGKKIDAGTKIYSHTKSGMTRAPIDHIESQSIGVTTRDDMKLFFDTEGVDETKWTTELSVDIKFNRLVLFRPWLWHGINKHFGDNITNNRLTHLIFLRPL